MFKAGFICILLSIFLSPNIFAADDTWRPKVGEKVIIYDGGYELYRAHILGNSRFKEDTICCKADNSNQHATAGLKEQVARTYGCTTDKAFCVGYTVKALVKRKNYLSQITQRSVNGTVAGIFLNGDLAILTEDFLDNNLAKIPRLFRVERDNVQNDSWWMTQYKNYYTEYLSTLLPKLY
jgi:hypothetical protein